MFHLRVNQDDDGGQARSIAARSNELGKSTGSEMRALAGAVSIPPGQAGFSCYDPTLSQRLTQAADQVAQPAQLTLRDASFNEGPAGVANAVKKLWENVGTYLTGMVRYVFSGGRAAIASKDGEPITGRDLIALLATIGINLGLLALTALNPPSCRSNSSRKPPVSAVRFLHCRAVSEAADGNHRSCGQGNPPSQPRPALKSATRAGHRRTKSLRLPRVSSFARRFNSDRERLRIRFKSSSTPASWLMASARNSSSLSV